MAALAACTLAALLANWRLLRPDFVSADALVHQYWMWQFRDPALFNDPLTAELRQSARYPEGYEALFRLASQFVDPIFFGELVGVALMALSGWLVFLIVREHTAWRPAAWLAAGLFLAMLEIHRFYGGFPRAFVHPVVLLTVLLALRDRRLAAALVAAAGALLYPPAAVLAVGVLCVSALGWKDGRPRIDGARARYAALAVGLSAVAVLGPQLASGGAPRVMTAAEARAFPEFGADGPLHFFVAVGRRLPEPEPQRVRPAHLGQHPRRRGAGAAAAAACQPAAAAARRSSRCRSWRCAPGGCRRRCCSSSTSRTGTRIR